MTTHTHQQSPLYLPEYTGASILLHAGCLALLFLNLHYYTEKNKSLPNPQQKTAPDKKKEPRVIMKRIPTTPMPTISEEKEAVGPQNSNAPQHEELKEKTESLPATTPTEVVQQIPLKIQEEKNVMQEEKNVVQKPLQEPSKAVLPKETPTAAQKTMIKTLQKAKRVKRSKMQHSWYANRIAAPQAHREATHMATDNATSLAIDEMELPDVFRKQTTSSSRKSAAQQAVENFNKEFKEAAVNDYIAAIHHAIAFALNRKRIMLSPLEIPQRIIMNLTITPQGSLAHVHVSIPGYPNTSLNEHIKQAILQAAPFRPFPSSIKTPELTLTINAYPDPDYSSGSDRYSSRATPLVFTLLNNNRNGL